MLNIKIVFYVYLVQGKWQDPFVRQIERLKRLGLYQQATVYVAASGDDGDQNELRGLIEKVYPEIVEKNFQSGNDFEYPGIKTIYDIAEDDENTVILYFHTKGIVSGQTRIGDLLSLYTLDNYEMYLDRFQEDKTLDVCGVIPSVYGFSYFNFFWVRSSYVRNFCSRPIPDNGFMRDERFTWEMWLGYFNGYSRKINIKTYSPLLNELAVSDEVGAMEVIRKIDFFESNNLDPYSSDFVGGIDTKYIGRRTLDQISLGCASVKISTVTDKITHHTYLPVYDGIFPRIRDSARNILEIGVWIGASLPLWRNYFSNAKIFAVDIHEKDFLTIEEIKNDSNIVLHMPADGYDSQFIYREFISKGVVFDLILDDGPHTLESQIECINKYLPLLAENGILVIEDIASFDFLKVLFDAVPESLRKHVRAYDLRKFKNRADDLLFIIDKGFDAASPSK